ncbi:DNA-binding Lrp family transcriptional regulator [Fontibacillus phaseoli]|uniref:siroheme decarboxylase n=1 Tax=Fontibacillus phaseoli TaxID=1416533 RepID=A0A369BM59_9BACL|nr:Lrp/AsnC family transcriptional regulator [Fontibacillus phaseoli]RCX22692.1 DNA-binding Lrp family transcriptional regulator [Fontibacillus phaseoli]
MDDIDLLLVRELQGELPFSPDPYGDIARRKGCTVDEVLLRLQRMRETGALKRVGAVLKHRNIGFSANGLFVGLLPEKHVDKAGQRLAGFSEVSHCYRRRPYPDWPYNLYAMIHGTSEEQVLQIVDHFVRNEAVEIYDTLFSIEELKKSSFSL